jgi:N-acetylglucosaminyl-diphospho-decaprenol L-rhamnosyltransferase
VGDIAVGVVTVTYNSGAVLDSFLTSLPIGISASAGVVVTDVIVVDNTDGADAAVAAIVAGRPPARLVKSENSGYGSGMNRGIAAIPDGTPFVLISNPDVVLTPTAIDALVHAAARYPDGGAFGPLIRTAEGAVYPSARRLPSLRTGIGHALFTRIWPANPWSARYREGIESYGDERVAGWLSGSCILLRRSAIDAVGGFDDSYFMYFEDVDLCDRLASAGWASYLIPTAEITHSGAHSTDQSSRTMMVAHHRSAYLYLARKYRAWYLWPLRVVLRVGLAARGWIASR